jgi:5-bromo-4-chloroindolyl phosphate hydrolysis protein
MTDQLIPDYFRLIGQKRKILQEIELTREQIRNLKRELNRINSEIEGSAKGTSRAEK